MYKLEMYKWLLGLLKESPRGLTFREIRNIYMPIGECMDLEKRTFHRCKKEIKDLFDITIECKREGNKYLYRARGLERIDINMLMLGDVLTKTNINQDNVKIKIRVDSKAVEWMENLLVDIKYECLVLKNGETLFEFKAPLSESLARSLLPFADSIEIKEPEELVTMVIQLLDSSMLHIIENSN